MRYFVRLAVSMGFALVAVAASPAEAGRRLALAVGIDVYDHLPAIAQLRRAGNDAEAMAAALRELGFEATLKKNVSRLDFLGAWQTFLNRLAPGDTAAVFFAGHGVEIGGLNYLLPRDVPKVGLGQDKVLAGASIRFNELMDDLREKKVRVSLLIVDACRDNPFREGSGRTVGGTRGLTRVEPAEGTFVMYSAGVGQQALDRLPGGADANPNSVYTRTLLPILRTPGLSLRDIAGRVQDEVIEVAGAAGHRQTPAYYDQAAGKLVLKAGVAQPQPSAGMETARICREVEGMANPATLAVLERQHKGTLAGECVAARIAQLKTAAAVVPPPPKVVEPLVAGPSNPPLSVKQGNGFFRITDPALSVKPGSGQSFRDRTAGGAPCAECPEMVVVPAGTFTMGSPASEPERESWQKGTESPQRRVTIARAFAVGKFEVTFAEWDSCLAEGGCSHRPDDNGWGRGKRPVINVSWDDITRQYLPWLSRKTGKTYRLLTEAEWEYAARAGTTTPFWWGSSTSTGQANYNGDYTYGGGPKGEYRQKTVPVDSFAPNPWGLYNVHGNVWEWVQDCWNDSYSRAPTDGTAWTTGECLVQAVMAADRRVVRGGAWYYVPRYLRSACRDWYSTVDRNNLLGFRLARTL